MEFLNLRAIIVTVLIFLAIRTAIKFLLKPFLLLKKLKKVRGAKVVYVPVVGTLLELKQCEKKHGDIFYAAKKRLQENPDIKFIVSPFIDRIFIELYDPELIKEFLNKDAAMTVKEMSFFGTFNEFALNGLSFVEGERWKEQRRHVSQVFHFEYMNKSMPILSQTAVEWIEGITSQGSTLLVTDISARMREFTAKVIWRVLFGKESSYEKKEVAELTGAILRLNATSLEQALTPWNLIFGPKFFKLGLRAVDRRHIKEYEYFKKTLYAKLEAIRANVIENKNSQTATNENSSTRSIVELLLEQKIKGEGLSDLAIVAQIYAFLVGGTDTTSELLTISHYHLAENPDIQEKLREEILANIGKTGAIQHEDFAKMDYLNAFVKEALRVGSPVPLLFRAVQEEFTIKDLKLEKGFVVTIQIPCLGYNPKYFSDINVFKPERWLEKKDSGTTNPFAFIPFSASSRRCIGEQLAMIEAKVMLCELLRRFKVDIKKPYKLIMGLNPVYGATEPMTAIYTPL